MSEKQDLYESARSKCLYLAPFQGITGVVFRYIWSKHFLGIHKMFTPFFTGISHNTKIPARRKSELGENLQNGIEVVPQILSKDAEEIIRFAQLCSNLGFNEINWNLGCPYPQVANKKKGSGMLPFPEILSEILEKISPEINIRFSIKCRLGYYQADEIQKLIPIFNHSNIAELCIHPRIGKQLYSGKPNTESFAMILPLITIPTIYNGDIFSKNDFLNLQQQFPQINTWMIGRGVLMDPFLPMIIQDIQLPENKQLYIKNYMYDLYFAYRNYFTHNHAALNVSKEYWSYLSQSFDNPQMVFKYIKRCKNYEEYELALNTIFSEHQWMGSENRNNTL